MRSEATVAVWHDGPLPDGVKAAAHRLAASEVCVRHHGDTPHTFAGGQPMGRGLHAVGQRPVVPHGHRRLTSHLHLH